MELITVQIGKFIKNINKKDLFGPIIQKTGSSNLLVNYMWSIVALRIWYSFFFYKTNYQNRMCLSKVAKNFEIFFG